MIKRRRGWKVPLTINHVIPSCFEQIIVLKNKTWHYFFLQILLNSWAKWKWYSHEWVLKGKTMKYDKLGWKTECFIASIPWSRVTATSVTFRTEIKYVKLLEDLMVSWSIKMTEYTPVIRYTAQSVISF